MCACLFVRLCTCSFVCLFVCHDLMCVGDLFCVVRSLLGNLTSAGLKSFFTEARASVGAGLSLNLGSMRVDAGFYCPLRRAATDQLSGRGFNLGLSVDLF
jgi:hypothetical protein